MVKVPDVLGKDTTWHKSKFFSYLVNLNVMKKLVI